MRALVCVAAVALVPCAMAQDARGAKPGSVEVRVCAEPKAGAKSGKTGSAGWSDYDGGADRGGGGADPMAPVDYKRLDNVVVWLEPADAGGVGALDASASEPVVIEVGSGKKPGPDGPPLSAVGVGQRVQFKNVSSKALAVFCVEKPNKFTLGSIAPGAKGEWVAAAPGHAEILTDVSDEPAALVVVAPTRFVEKTRAGSDAEFDRVPAGAWRVRAWHRRMPAQPVAVDVAAGKKAEATVVLGVGALPEAP